MVQGKLINIHIFRVNKVLEKHKMKPMKTSKAIVEINIKATILTQFYIKIESFENNSKSRCSIKEMSIELLVRIPAFLYSLCH